nr:SRPBCC family protein [Ramlibacter aurantiacus]
MTVAAPPARVWELLLDPNVMGGCVPGMKSIEVISPTEYLAVMHVKISFISAKFRLKTKIVEQREPHYLRSEGTGEDTSVASSLKQQSEIFLTELPDGGTELKMKVKVDVLGRLGSFGLSVMKTKADRMWEEFGQNLAAQLKAGSADTPAPASAHTLAAAPAPAPAASTPAPGAVTAVVVDDAGSVTEAAPDGWLSRLLSGPRRAPANGRSIRIEIKRADVTVTVHWPLEAASECAAMLREALR